MYSPGQGDIVVFSFDPSSGKEVMKRRPAIVISKKIFNEHTGFVVVAPITSTVRNMRLEVVLPSELETQGAVIIHQMKSLDFEDRRAVFIEKASAQVLQKVIALAKAIVS
jgi:mRNA-degrading endonuclease toxin of MazEF toxin-antitoxin module